MPEAGQEEEACNVYCNPSARYNSWENPDYIYPHSGNDGFRCWGRGQCEFAEESEGAPTCRCDQGLDPETFCAYCDENLYPKYQWTSNPTKPHCSVLCDEAACHNNGKCNPYAFKNEEEQLCHCNLNEFGMDTFNKTERCRNCEDHWGPNEIGTGRACSSWCSDDMITNMESGCLNLVKNYTDMKKDIVIEKINLMRQPHNITVRLDDPNNYRIVDCLNCIYGECNFESQCICQEGVTGIECQKACKLYKGQVCAGHGDCKQNELFLHFNPESDLTVCECEPFDDYTVETREYYTRLGVVLDPPPPPEYYGQTCEYHCPTYNQQICADRGKCTTRPVDGGYRCKQSISTSDEDNPDSCMNKMSGQDIDGVFCEVTGSPWDAKAATVYKTASYFTTPSPGAVQCKLSSCQKDIFEYDWSGYCKAMLKGLYPQELNNPVCAHNKDHDSLCAGLKGHVKCSQALEDAFSKSKTCSDFDLNDNNEDGFIDEVVIYDAWDTEQMDASVIVLNVKYVFQNNEDAGWREMTPFVFYIEAKDQELYPGEYQLASYGDKHTKLDVVLGKDNTLIIKNLETSGPNQICGDSYGLKWKKLISDDETGDGTGTLEYADDTCFNTNCPENSLSNAVVGEEESYTTNPWSAFEPIRPNPNGYLYKTSPSLSDFASITNQGQEDGTTNNIPPEQAAIVALTRPGYNVGLSGYFTMGVGIDSSSANTDMSGKIWYYKVYPEELRNPEGGFNFVQNSAYKTYRAGIPIKKSDGCCKCNGQTTNDLLKKALDTGDTNTTSTLFKYITKQHGVRCPRLFSSRVVLLMMIVWVLLAE